MQAENVQYGQNQNINMDGNVENQNHNQGFYGGAYMRIQITMISLFNNDCKGEIIVAKAKSLLFEYARTTAATAAPRATGRCIGSFMVSWLWHGWQRLAVGGLVSGFRFLIAKLVSICFGVVHSLLV